MYYPDQELNLQPLVYWMTLPLAEPSSQSKEEKALILKLCPPSIVFILMFILDFSNKLLVYWVSYSFCNIYLLAGLYALHFSFIDTDFKHRSQNHKSVHF